MCIHNSATVVSTDCKLMYTAINAHLIWLYKRRAYCFKQINRALQSDKYRDLKYFQHLYESVQERITLLTSIYLMHLYIIQCHGSVIIIDLSSIAAEMRFFSRINNDLNFSKYIWVLGCSWYKIIFLKPLFLKSFTKPKKKRDFYLLLLPKIYIVQLL